MAVRYWPLARDQLVIGSTFGYRDGGWHAGQDFPAPDGTPFYAIQSGTVLYIGSAQGYGQWIVIDSDDDEGAGVWEYGHMWNAFATGLAVGSHVQAGQLIGYVGSNGESSGPHLHTSYMPRGYDARTKVDPLAILQGAVWPGGLGLPAPTTEEPTVSQIQWGVDVSNHQPNFNFAGAALEGFTFATHKITEGDFYTDPYWERALDEMRQHFPGRFGGYHFYRRSSDPNRAADRLAASIKDTSVPIQLDFEDVDADRNVTADEMFRIINCIQDRGMQVRVNYLPRWYHNSWMNSCDIYGTPPIWNSDYGPNRSGYASVIYPGDDNPAWRDFQSGVPVEIFQFSERGWVAGMQNVDVNAYKGTIIDLAALFAGISKEDIVAAADDEMTKRFPSRSAYRNTDQPIDTVAGFVTNMDARIHEQFVEQQALAGNAEYIELVKRVARDGIVGDTTGFDGGDAAGLKDRTKRQAQAILDKIEAAKK